MDVVQISILVFYLLLGWLLVEASESDGDAKWGWMISLTIASSVFYIISMSITDGKWVDPQIPYTRILIATPIYLAVGFICSIMLWRNKCKKGLKKYKDAVISYQSMSYTPDKKEYLPSLQGYAEVIATCIFFWPFFLVRFILMVILNGIKKIASLFTGVYDYFTVSVFKED